MIDRDIIDDTIDIAIEIERGVVVAIHAVDHRYVGLKIAIIDIDQPTLEEGVEYSYIESSIKHMAVYNAQMSINFPDLDEED